MLLDCIPHNKIYNDFVVNVIGTHTSKHISLSSRISPGT